VFLPVPEQQCDAPQSGQSHQRVNDAGQNGHLAAKEERHRVKAEQADAAPVQGTDDDQQQRKLVKQHMLYLHS
jgi:hypothetical protein